MKTVKLFTTRLQEMVLIMNLILFPEALGGHSEVAITCLLSGFETALDYQIINYIGDINNDGSITLLDLTIIVSYLFEESNFSDIEFWAGDINFDNNISISDILILSESLE